MDQVGEGDRQRRRGRRYRNGGELPRPSIRSRTDACTGACTGASARSNIDVGNRVRYLDTRLARARPVAGQQEEEPAAVSGGVTTAVGPRPQPGSDVPGILTVGAGRFR